jgi:predicted deacylase
MPKRTTPRLPFEFHGHHVPAGTRQRVPLLVGSYLTYEELHLQVTVIHGKNPGPTLLLTGCIHGDEFNSTEIIRRILRQPILSKLAGTLLAVPIVNRPGFVNRSRYMPDRRDLNRLFPGSAGGPLGSRLARVLSEDVLPRADAVIDLHTGAVNRPNLSQVRVSEGDRRSLELAKVFAPPITLVGRIREGSFRATCRETGTPMLLFESGEALRLDTPSIRFGTQGILTVMRHLDMLPRRKREYRTTKSTLVADKSFWQRAPAGGLFTPLVALGKAVEQGTLLGFVADPQGGGENPVVCDRHGLVIGRTNDAVVDEGDGLFHIAVLANLDALDDAENHIARNANALPSVDADDDHPVAYDSINDTIL